MTNHLSVDAKQLQAEVARLRRENADLRASALLWQRLYDQALEAETRAELDRVDSASSAKKRQKHTLDDGTRTVAAIAV